MACTLVPDLQIEALDDGYLILRPGHHDVVRLVGDQIEAFDLAREGVADVPDHLQPAMAGLVELGIVRSDTWSRRRVIQLGGAAAAAAATVVALPGVAAAASTPGTSTTGNPPTTAPAGFSVSYLVVAGGGAGCDYYQGGGGGAGGVLRAEGIALALGNHTVVVGAGGTNYGDGHNSSLGTSALAIGGGKGDTTDRPAGDGGSGGGGGLDHFDGGSGTTDQGHAGADATFIYDGKPYWAGGGGGGAGAAGAKGRIVNGKLSAGKGGDGVYSDLAAAVGIGSPSGYVGGGGGGSSWYLDLNTTGGSGGKGGGGRGTVATLSPGNWNGAANTGSGGGSNGRGGSGVVIVAYDIAAAVGRSITGGTVTDVGTTRYHVFDSVGTHTFSIG